MRLENYPFYQFGEDGSAFDFMINLAMKTLIEERDDARRWARRMMLERDDALLHSQEFYEQRNDARKLITYLRKYIKELEDAQ